ncbi:MAG: iron hydrogenase, partial [Clostridia bacterium]|nr:iron hydrogenase [Clostridia bacterium]
MFEAKHVDFAALESIKVPSSASADGRGFSVSGGVATAVVNCLKELDPEREVMVEHAEGLNECRKMLMRAKAGKLNGYLLEGMACPGGCIGGAGTVQLIPKAAQEVEKIKKISDKAHAYESTYTEYLTMLEE